MGCGISERAVGAQKLSHQANDGGVRRRGCRVVQVNAGTRRGVDIGLSSGRARTSARWGGAEAVDC